MAFCDLYFSLGSNQGNRQQNILRAVERMDEELGIRHAALSHLIETQPWGRGVSARFINACARYRLYQEADPTAQCLRILRQCQAIEQEMGRTPVREFDADGNRIYHDRPIDIDMLFFGTHHIDTDELMLPHPLIARRDFVLIPLREIAKPALKASFPELFA